ncbi:MAG: pyridoxine 5'-phosphate synthase [Pyrinomonadaceae bacterium]
MTPRLNINVDHVATVRQARRAPEPSVLAAALVCEEAGADGITVHLRGDRRHIQDDDLYILKRSVTTYLNVEMAATEEMMRIALDVRPDAVTLVPETPHEITTEGGLDVVANFDTVRRCVERLKESGQFVSLFVDPEARQLEASREAGADQVELCTAAYADATLGARGLRDDGRRRAEAELRRLRESAVFAAGQNLHVAAGHGLTYRNVSALAAVAQITEYNIGHNVIAHAIFAGLAEAVREMRRRIMDGQS